VTPWCRGTSDSSLSNGSGSDDNSRIAPWSKSCRRSLSDGILLHARQDGGELGYDHRYGSMRCLSVPAMGSPATPSLEKPQLPTLRLSLSQARLIIPRSVSEYLSCCRFARSHSDGLLLASTALTGALESCRDAAPRALSEGLLGGRLFPTAAAAPSSPGGSSSASPAGPPPKPRRRVPLAELHRGAVLEGRIVHRSGVGVFVDVGTVRHGLIAWHRCRGGPRRLLQPPEVIANLEVINVNSRKRQLSLRIAGIGADDANLEEVDYAKILQRIAGWAGVVLPPGRTAAATVVAASRCVRTTRAGAARGRGRRQATSKPVRPRWRIKGEADAKATASGLQPPLPATVPKASAAAESTEVATAATDASSATMTPPRCHPGEGKDAAVARCPGGRRGRKLLWRRKSVMGA